jgi:hypothetical protein
LEFTSISSPPRGVSPVIRSPVKLPNFTAQSLTLNKHFTWKRVTERYWLLRRQRHQIIVGKVVRSKSKSVAELHEVVAENVLCIPVQKGEAAAQISELPDVAAKSLAFTKRFN